MWAEFSLKAFIPGVDARVVRFFPARHSHRTGRPSRWLVVATVALLAAAGPAAAPAQATADNPAADENAFVAALNATRAGGGLPPLQVDGELRALARDWAQHQADAGTISHANPISAGVTADWRKLGENVGMGGSVPSIMNAFIKSPGHYANIMDPEFTRVGVGVVWVGNTLFTTHRFMKVAGESATPEPAPQPAPEPEPAPKAPPTTDPTAKAPSAAPAPRPTPTVAPVEPPPPPPPPPANPARVASVLALLRSVPA